MAASHFKAGTWPYGVSGSRFLIPSYSPPQLSYSPPSNVEMCVVKRQQFSLSNRFEPDRSHGQAHGPPSLAGEGGKKKKLTTLDFSWTEWRGGGHGRGQSISCCWCGPHTPIIRLSVMPSAKVQGRACFSLYSLFGCPVLHPSMHFPDQTSHSLSQVRKFSFGSELAGVSRSF